MKPPYPLSPEHESKREGTNTVYHYKDNFMTPIDLSFFNNNLALPANLEAEQAKIPGVPWTPVLRTHNINVDKRKAPGEAITAIRGVSKLKNVNPDVFYKHLTTPELMKGWMGNLIAAKIVPSRPELNVTSGSFTQTHDTIFTTYKYPGILSNRDALSSRSLYVDKEAGLRMIMWRSTWHPDFPPTNKFIRTWTFGCYMVCDDPNDPNSCIYYSFGMVDARGWLPDWFVTQFCPTGIKTLCKKVSKCCIRYQQQTEEEMPTRMERKTSLEDAIQKVERVALGEVSESDGGILSEDMTSDGGGAMSDAPRQRNKKMGVFAHDGAVSDGGRKKSDKDKRKEKMTKFVIGMAMGGGAGLKKPNLKSPRSPKTQARSPLSPKSSIKMYFKKKFKRDGEGVRIEGVDDDDYEDGDGDGDNDDSIGPTQLDLYEDEEPDSFRSEDSVGDDEDDEDGDLKLYRDTISGVEEREEGNFRKKKKKKGLRKSLGGAVDSIKDDINVLKERLKLAQEARRNKNKIKKERKREKERIKREQRAHKDEQNRIARGNATQNFSIFSKGSKGSGGYRERGGSDTSRGRKASDSSRHREKAMSPGSISRFLSGGVTREGSGKDGEGKMSLRDKFKKKLGSTRKKKLFGRGGSSNNGREGGMELQDEKPESL
ncbi:hypothetical protein TrRE_jg9791 [Triparma retinervis]|uniref:START domain-containing protein n=1 Tax=Triparma retinervis TaxID=2557542 RepID=A0A9W7FVM3_9STRA|nr:hypothetical protein TrRE_jg9791 [Triparma retinervis]